MQESRKQESRNIRKQKCRKVKMYEMMYESKNIGKQKCRKVEKQESRKVEI